ncbi:MAG TPA: peptidyl-prolyl cis-trans isomerase [Candidatus Saccharimonadales bacterium]|nr:peptidyl-prolyl cis-trans isomerase [Candidatus Saccharimonadales bacterium]
MACGAALLFALAARADLVSGISVVVNDSVITYAEIQGAVAPRAQLAAQLYANEPARLQEEVQKLKDQQIEQLVERKLILHEFITSGYATNVVESFIDGQIQDKIKREYYGDRARLIETLHAEGVSAETFRRQEREDFIVRYMIYQNVTAPKKTLISPLRIEQYYGEHQNEFKVDDQVKMRMIFITNSPDAGESRKVAAEILAKIDSGVPFKEMAAVYSAGSQRAEGGERGWVDRKFFKQELADAAFSLKPGQHSGVIELPEGCYLIMVEDARQSHVKPLVEVRADIERALKNEENSRLHKQWIDRLKKKSFIEYY